MPWPIPQGLWERALARSVSRTSRQWRAGRWPFQQPHGNRRRCPRKRRHPVVHARFFSHRSVTARDAHSVEDWRRHALFIVENTVEDRAGQRRGRLRLDAALEAAEDGHVAGLQVRSGSWWIEAQQDMREIGLRGRQGGITGVDAGKIERSSKKDD